MENKNTDIKMLVILAQQGDHQAFDQLYTLFVTPIYRYIYLRLRDKQLSEDLTQTVFLKAYISLKTYQDKNKPVLAYFFTIARNSIIDHVRKQGNRATSDLSEAEQKPDEKTNIPKEVDGRLANEQIKEKLGDLTEEQQEVVILKFINGFSNREIAEILGKTEMAVRQLQSRGIRTLRELLKGKI
jgi:RNA polymerase sigma-70 factor, ECF subfamily